MSSEGVERAEQPRPRKPGRPRKSEAQDTKAELLRAAVTLFAERGYAGTSIRAIARAVGLSESVLYAHYQSKQAIFDAATELLGPASVASVMSDIDAKISAKDPEQYLRQVCEHAIEAWDTEQARQYMSLISRDGLIHEQFLSDAIDDVVGKLAQRFQGWMTAGVVPPGLGGADDLVFALMTPLVQSRILWLHGSATEQQRAVACERMRRHTEFFVRAVIRHAPGRPSGTTT